MLGSSTSAGKLVKIVRVAGIGLSVTSSSQFLYMAYWEAILLGMHDDGY
jgi:hypothetical protein